MSRAKQEKGEIESAKLGLRARLGAELTQSLDVFNWEKIWLLRRRMAMKFGPKTKLLLSLFCWVFCWDPSYEEAHVDGRWDLHTQTAAHPLQHA